MEIHRITRFEAVEAAGHLFDEPPREEATRRFLDDPGHHLFIAYEDGVPAGMITGVEMTHPDKGTEMFVYELGVDEPYRRRGIAAALVSALAELGRGRGCYGMWVITDEGNTAARATYGRFAQEVEQDQVVFSWTFDET
ncbi:GNAT family N-acetyltransferase [Actinomadura sp. HBU206391]|uniref:GNAT family N-acetyltransferase n=1 Tax=Actinomadura sp. HBU206391 TaxID=2731692 RepID=UPI0016502866|nr:GNAT family N-acetyltransferase [Actinomadura sp. HBU206391]MBC6457190.1 GNAT family N-acetyltransferase [Actinomadura sp. HBU206391]